MKYTITELHSISSAQDWFVEQGTSENYEPVACFALATLRTETGVMSKRVIPLTADTLAVEVGDEHDDTALMLWHATPLAGDGDDAEG
jgi:hypothetical protein